MMKKLFAFMLAMMLLLSAAAALAAGSLVEDVWLETEVVAKGHKMKEFHLTVKDPAVLEGLTAKDFSIYGLACQWLDPTLHEFEADIGKIKVDGNEAVLTVINFNEKYFYVDSYTVMCKNARLTFTKEDLSKEVTPIVDDFEKFTVAGGAPINYNLYTPADTSVAQPLVLALHGWGDYENLVQNRVVTAFAEPHHQSVRPCYVMGPLFMDPETEVPYDPTEILAKSVEIIKGMIAEGKVDAKRVYVTGKSMGGGNTVKAMLEYPDFFAAGMPMCPYFSTEGVDLSPLVGQKIWFIANEADDTVPAVLVKGLYDQVVALGSETAQLRLFSQKEMNVLGYDEYHAVDMQVHADDTFFEWMFAQVKE